MDVDFGVEMSIADPCRESIAIGDLALLLILSPIEVDPACFERWRDVWRSGRDEPDPAEAEFYHDYNACLESAMQFGIDHHSA